MKRRLLLVEDDAALADMLCAALSDEGFEIHHVSDGNQAVEAANRLAPDLVLLSTMLPGKSGFDLCLLWQYEHRFPIIVLSACARKTDILRAFRAGADDCVIKPVDVQELLARIHAVLRRARPIVERLRLGGLAIDFAHFTAERDGESITLSRREFELLQYLAERPNVVVERDELLRTVWRYPEVPFTRSVDKAVARLRQKIESDPQHPAFIHTARAGGYWLCTNAEDFTK